MRHSDLSKLLEIEQGQALRKELSVDNALAEARDYAEADAASELVKGGTDALQIVRFDVLEAVPQHDPVDALAGLLGPRGAAVPDQLGIKARLGYFVVLRMNLADEVEVDEAVVHRRDERVRPQDRGLGDRVVTTGGVDDDDVRFCFQACDSG